MEADSQPYTAALDSGCYSFEKYRWYLYVQLQAYEKSLSSSQSIYNFNHKKKHTEKNIFFVGLKHRHLSAFVKLNASQFARALVSRLPGVTAISFLKVHRRAQMDPLLYCKTIKALLSQTIMVLLDCLCTLACLGSLFPWISWQT